MSKVRLLAERSYSKFLPKTGTPVLHGSACCFGFLTKSKRLVRYEMWVPVSAKETGYSMRAATTSLPRILTSIPSGGRKSDPCAIAPRASTPPGIDAYFNGS